MPQVAGSVLTLIEEIDQGGIEAPDLIDYRAWLRWRGEVGREPPRPPRELHGYRLQRESNLWRTTMAHLYGED